MRDTESGHLTVGGLFSGIGGWELGLERAGMRVLWHCEADPYARSVLERHWPGVPCYPDVRELRGDDVEPVDVLAGGFPCQDISVAGRGAGITGARSSLWGEMLRLTDELEPRYLLVENVAALIARGLDVVLSGLAEIGFDAEWDCLRASDFGAPHRRERIWLVAYPGSARRRQDARGAHGDEAAHEGRSAPDDHVADGHGQGGRARHVADAECIGWDGRPRLGGPSDPHRAEAERREGAGQPGRCDSTRAASLRLVGSTPWATEPDVGRVAHGVPARVDRLRCLGNALVPQIAEWIGGRVTAFEESRLAEEAASAPAGAAGLHGIRQEAER
jgi:DNA (cytosine-5)-methyltransferase 1